jgi:hypothetical protein
MVAPSVVVAWVVVMLRPGISCAGSRAVPCRPGVGPGDGVRAALDRGELDVVDQAGQAFGGLVWRQDLVRVSMEHQHGHGWWASLIPFRSGIGLDGGEVSGSLRRRIVSASQAPVSATPDWAQWPDSSAYAYVRVSFALLVIACPGR